MVSKMRVDVLYSQECLITAFLQLLGQKKFQEISVSELCKRAGVARITYYKYYKSLNDLLKASVEYYFEIFKDKLRGKGYEVINDVKKVLEVTMEQIVPIKDALISLSNSSMSGVLLQYFTAGVRGLLPILEKDFELKKIKHLFIAGGIFNILIEWVKNGMSVKPKKMAEQIYATMRDGWL